MPTNEKLKPLYMAKTIGELNKYTSVAIGTGSVKVKCNSAHKVFNEAERSRKDGDEERAYVLYMKYYSLLQNINKLADYRANKKFYEDLLGKTALVQSVEWAEKLQTSLQRRYSLLQEENECIEKQEREEISSLQISSGILDSSEESNHLVRLFEKSVSLIEAGQSLIIDNDVKTTLKGCITSRSLYDIISDNFYSLLIIDARSAASYKESHFIYQNCLNVPEEVIRPGLTGTALEKCLPSDTLLLWEKRSHVDYVILLDWISTLSTVVPGTKLHHLKDTLCKWDTRVTLKNGPLILEGGYEDWLLHYPTYTTCSWVKVPKNLRKNDVDDISLDFEYPTLDDVVSNGSGEASSVFLNHTGENHRPTVDRSVKPKKDCSSSDQFHFSGTSTSESPSMVAVASSSKAQTPSTCTRSSSTGVLSEELCSIPQVDRALKPSGSESSSDQDDLDKSVQQMKEIIAKEQILVNENLNIEKERLKSEQQYESIRQQQENELPENSKSDISKKEQILLERIQVLEAEKMKKANEEMALKQENAAIKKQFKEMLQFQDDVYAKFNKEKEQMKQKEKERRRLERETERLRQERKKREQEKKESPKRDTPQPSTATTIASDKAVEKESSPTKRLPKTESSTSSGQQRRDSSAGDSYFVKLKNDATSQSSSSSASRRPSLTRSHSSPNIAQMMAIEEDDKGSNAYPQVDRTVKPFTKTERKMPMISQLQPAEYSAARMRNLMPVYGNQGRALTGIRNLGNTCFMNSIIQCLAQTTSLATYFVSGAYRQHLNRQNPVGRRGEIAEEFAVIIRALWAGQYRSITPRDFINTVSKFISMFETHEQQDSQEFLCFLMDGLHEDLNEVKEKPQVKPQNIENLHDVVAAEKAWELHKQLNESLIVSLFQGQLKSTVRCLHCGKQSVKFDTFMYLSLPIPTGTNRCSLNECLALFLKEEKMTGGSRWKCPKCGEPREAEKKMDIWKLPPVLLIHLKRFSYEGMWRRKLQTFVEFPVKELDMRNYVMGPKRSTSYQLYAVSNHYGTMEGGHYTAFCRNAEYRRWYKFDDHEVSEMASSEVMTAAGYILFYTSMDMQVPEVKD